MGHFLCQAHVKEKKVGKAKKKNHRTLLILLFSLAVLAVVAFFAMHKIGSRSLSFSRKERFFLNGTLNKNVDEIITELGEPDRITEYAGIYVYRDFELAGMTGLLEFEVYNGKIRAAYWTLGEIDVDDYWPQINRIKGYFNKHYKQTDIWDWRKDDNNAYIVGITAGYYIRVLFQ